MAFPASAQRGLIPRRVALHQDGPESAVAEAAKHWRNEPHDPDFPPGARPQPQEPSHRKPGPQERGRIGWLRRIHGFILYHQFRHS